MSALFRATRAADFDGVYRRHAASVYRYVYAVLGNHADAEDVTQQTFIKAYRAIARGTQPRKAENWLMTIAHNEVRRHFRKTHGRPLEVELDERLEHPVPERPDPSVSDVLRALQYLPPAQRAALVMREFEGRSYKEIAQILGVTQSALEGLIFRARRALAEQLEGAFTCVEAEGALLRRMDRRLARREARRLKAHLRECPTCVQFATVQKRQRSLLQGLSVLPVPASLFAFRGDPALAATGLGTGAATAGGSAAIGLGGTGGAGIAAGVAAKAAAVAATAAVAGGVGYGVATAPEPVAKAERSTALAAAVEQTRRGGRALEVQQALARGERPGPALPAQVRTYQRKKAKTPSRANPTPGATTPARQAKLPNERARAQRSSATLIKAGLEKRAPQTPTRRRTRPRAEVEKKTQQPRTKKPAPVRPTRPAQRPKPAPAAGQRPPLPPGLPIGVPPTNPVPPTVPPGQGPKR
jgi:RNA polymerase sigma-70 factor, ECF subfamily